MPYKDIEDRRAARRRYEDAHPERNKRKRTSDRHKDNRGRMAKRRNAARLDTTFTGVDGEGWTDENGRHHYMLLVAGDRTLYTGQPLTALECLDFLTSLPCPKNHYYVGYFFDYDVTMILRDIVADAPLAAQRLFDPDKEFGEFVHWSGYQIDYLPKKRLRVRREGRPTVTIHDTRNFFQCAFHKALVDFGVGAPEERDLIAGMKAGRATFNASQIDEITTYCKLECRLLADLTAELRDRFAIAELSAHPYEGPGPIAGRVLTAHVGRDKQAEYRSMLPAGVVDFAQRAYYGGRFETTAVGTVAVPVWGYDIKSAYPAAMLDLPCLEHSEWRQGIHSDLYVAHVTWDMPDLPDETAKVLGPLPHRIRKTGAIIYPTGGEGWYWSCEIPPYAKIKQAFSYIHTCDCQPFSWVNDLYVRRQEMEAAAKGSGIALKLTLNSLYGKLAQRIGRAPHYNPIWAGLITAMTRAKIYQVYLDHPETVVMYATDAVFMTEPAPELTLGTALGQWEPENDGEPYEHFCVFRPGIYFDSGTARFKTRGIPKKEFQEKSFDFMLAANGWNPDDPTSVTLTRDNHLSLRQGLAWGEGWYGRIGDWVPSPKEYSPRPMPKRLDTLVIGDGADATWWTRPLPNLGAPTWPYEHDKPQPWDNAARADEQWDDGTYDAMLTDWIEGG